MLPQLKWNNFTGVHAIVLKGCTSPNVSTYESTLSLLSQFTPFLEIALMDPSIGSAFAINVMALLPYMVANYEDATPLCIRSAENIAHVSTLTLQPFSRVNVQIYTNNFHNNIGEHGKGQKDGKFSHGDDALQSSHVQQGEFPMDQMRR